MDDYFVFQPDGQAKFSAAERALLRDDIEVDALARLLAALPLDARPAVLNFFSAKNTLAGILADGSTEDKPDSFNSEYLWSDDPTVQQLIESVYSPLRKRIQLALSRNRRSNEAKFLRTPFLIGLTSEGSKCLILRRAATIPHDVIVLSSAYATTEWLHTAIQALLAARHSTGIAPSIDEHIPITTSEREVLPSSWEQHLAATLQGATAARRQFIDNVGWVRAVAWQF